MILVEKKQRGGIFAPTQIDFGARDFSGLLQAFQYPKEQRYGRSDYGATRPSRKSTATDLSEGLESDVAYYIQRKNQLKNEIKAGFDTDPANYGASSEYETKLRQYYDLEVNVPNTIDSKKKQYMEAVKSMRSNESAGTPAIQNGMALVQNNSTGAFDIVTANELLSNPKEYVISDMMQAADLRESNPAFSGYTRAGKLLDGMIQCAYGHKQFNSTVMQGIKSLGYSSDENGRIVTGGGSFDVDDITFETYKIKTNAPQVESLVTGLLNTTDSQFSDYVNNQAIFDMHRAAKTETVDFSKMSPDEVARWINDDKAAIVGRATKHALREEYKVNSKKAAKTTSKYEKDLTMEINNIMLATVGLDPKLGGELKIEDKTGIKNTSLLFQVSGKKVQEGYEWLADGYTKGTAETEESANLRPLSYNTRIDNLTTYKNNISDVSGNKISEVSVNGLDGVGLDPSTSMFMVVAPVVNGVVNFDIPEIEAYADIYKRMNADLQAAQASASKDDLTDGTLEKKINTILDIYGDEASKGAEKLNIEFKLTAAFDVIVQSKQQPTNSVSIKNNEIAVNYYKKYVDEEAKARNLYKIKAFAPIGPSMWQMMSAPDAWGTQYKMKFNPAVLNTNTTMKKGITRNEIARSFSQTKKDGGILW